MDKEVNKFHQDESEDAILARIQEESLRYYNEVELPRRAAEQKEKEKNKECSPKKSVDFEPQPHCSKTIDSSSSQATQHREVFYKASQGSTQGADGFHLAAGETYVYPTNYPVRKYQKTIIHSALFHNTLVSLPTGLGKTFIAAVVMYNYYRWFPQGKIVFMAPTRPLVAQQIRACHDIMAIPIKDTIEMTGTLNPNDRVQHWKNKRVFFLTPQVMANDLRTKACPAKSFKCVVIDEAHRATKEYSYCHVIKELENAGAVFRVLALSATPGSNIKAVIEVVQNLRISTLELRGEDSPDVMPYTHAKQIEPVSLTLSKHITDFREQFLFIFERYAKSLREARLVTCNVQNLTKFQLLKASEKIRSRPPNGVNKGKMGMLMADFTVCMTLAHGLDLLQTYGLRAFHQYFTSCEDEENRKAAFTRLSHDGDFCNLLDKLQKAVSSPMDQFWSHPKHETLVKILKGHFCEAEKQGTDTKVIIFCQYRVVVSELYELLLKIHPLIKPVMFIGQGAGKDSSGLPQKKQIEVMKGFREGRSNVLIATCVAEEGLDIGSVDLLLMMECQRSPVRLVQRLGRTGRHRQGRCVVLLTSGREVQKFNEAMATRKSFITTIQNSKVLKGSLYKDEPTMVPSHLMPRMQLVHINVPERITPGKKKKQSDICQALTAKLNNSEELEESPFLNPEQLSLVKEELNTLEMKFDSLTSNKPEYLFHRINETPMNPEELFSPTLTQHSEYNDWNRVLHQTYLVLHSSDTETLCHLLSKSESMLLNSHTDLNTQQINCSSVFPSKKDVKKNKTKNDNMAKKKKNLKEERQGMDIRECMAQAADRVRLTQNKLSEEENLVVLPEPVVIEISETLSEEICKEKENKNISSEDLKEYHCLFCDKGSTFIRRNTSKEFFNDDFFYLDLNTLKSVETFVQNLTKEAVNNLNVAKIFSSDSDCTINNIQDSLLEVKKSTSLITDKTLISVDDIFEDDLRTPPKPFSQPSIPQQPSLLSHPSFKRLMNTSEKGASKEISKQSKMNPDIDNQEYFNLDDLFNEDDDDLGFNSLVKNTKTSTPITKERVVVSGHSMESSVIEKENPHRMRDSEKENNDSVNVKNGINKTNVLPVSKLSKKTLFKIPQMKLNLGTFSSPKAFTNLPNYDNSLRPGSPILSGQVTSNQESNASQEEINISPFLSGQVTANQYANPSTVLPIGMVSNEDKNMSPILSGQVTSTPKLEGRVLFEEAASSRGYNVESSELCKPLGDEAIKHSDTAAAEIEALNLLSASQLFDDSDEEDNRDDLEQSSMYTVSQMVAKVSVLAKKNIPESMTFNNINKKKEHSIKFGSSDEDSMFDQINLDAFPMEGNGALDTKEQPDSKNNLEDSMLNCNRITKLPNCNLSDASDVESNEIAKINLLRKANRLRDTSINVDHIEKLPLKESTMENEESFIASRWLSCMKTPLKKNVSVSFAANLTNNITDSDSDSDVFENPLRKNKTKDVNRKAVKQPQFLELEADVSGPVGSSDEENTSGLDDLDASFINDMTELPSTSVDQTVLDIQAKYLQSVKSPMKRPGFKIPTLTDSVLGRDVFSQAIPEEDDSYQNDSFCCDSTQIPVEDEPSELEIAERLLRKKSRRTKKRKRKCRNSDSSSGDDSDRVNEELKRKRLLSSSSSNEDLGQIQKRKHLSSSDSSPGTKHSKNAVKKKRRIQLLTSDSDSDKTL